MLALNTNVLYLGADNKGRSVFAEFTTFYDGKKKFTSCQTKKVEYPSFKYISLFIYYYYYY